MPYLRLHGIAESTGYNILEVCKGLDVSVQQYGEVEGVYMDMFCQVWSMHYIHKRMVMGYSIEEYVEHYFGRLFSDEKPGVRTRSETKDHARYLTQLRNESKIFIQNLIRDDDLMVRILKGDNVGVQQICKEIEDQDDDIEDYELFDDDSDDNNDDNDMGVNNNGPMDPVAYERFMKKEEAKAQMMFGGYKKLYEITKQNYLKIQQ